jgi:hypothetical protein
LAYYGDADRDDRPGNRQHGYEESEWADTDNLFSSDRGLNVVPLCPTKVHHGSATELRESLIT